MSFPLSHSFISHSITSSHRHMLSRPPPTVHLPSIPFRFRFRFRTFQLQQLQINPSPSPSPPSLPPSLLQQYQVQAADQASLRYLFYVNYHGGILPSLLLPSPPPYSYSYSCSYSYSYLFLFFYVVTRWHVCFIYFASSLDPFSADRIKMLT
ncbi:hypothetical protein B0F90DRAFT_1262716 [Multifurca ochricompacta]|uniref:Uncharacterized protein n=1 Tax=Multifurca ochricompacta TaxID=376703 RepID=A0AAD4M9E5_9AGAM|nr:hypothetical protein B0F90DRAFT_1262716 [Multifurca ochricompacta]